MKLGASTMRNRNVPGGVKLGGEPGRMRRRYVMLSSDQQLPVNAETYTLSAIETEPDQSARRDKEDCSDNSSVKGSQHDKNIKKSTEFDEQMKAAAMHLSGGHYSSLDTSGDAVNHS